MVEIEKKWILHMVMLGVCSVEDWREKTVSLWKIVLYGILILVYEIWEIAGNHLTAETEIKKMLFGALPGIFLLLLGKMSQEAVGYADGLLVLCIGVSMGFWVSSAIFLTALLGIFASAVLLFLYYKRPQKYRIAFVPFLFLAMAGAGLWIKS